MEKTTCLDFSVSTEYLSARVSGHLAYTVAIERSQVLLTGQEKVAGITLRVTHVFQKEDDSGRIERGRLCLSGFPSLTRRAVAHTVGSRNRRDRPEYPISQRCVAEIEMPVRNGFVTWPLR